MTKGPINMMTAARDQMKKEHEGVQKEPSLEEAQRLHDAAMRANPDQMRAIEALDNVQTVAKLNLDQQIEQLEHQLTILRQKRAEQRGLNPPVPEPKLPLLVVDDDDVVEKKDEEVDAASERKQPESNQSKHSTGKKFR